MADRIAFRTMRLSGRAPSPLALDLYGRLFAATGARDLGRDVQDWERHGVAPWTLAHAGHDVGVGGFRIGFGDDGLEVLFHFIPEVWGQGLASEFLAGALDHARLDLREQRFFGRVFDAPSPSSRVMENAGFHAAETDEDGALIMRLG